MKTNGGKTIKLLAGIALFFCSQSALAVTTEFQARLNDADQMKQVGNIFQLDNKSKPVQY